MLNAGPRRLDDYLVAKKGSDEGEICRGAPLISYIRTVVQEGGSHFMGPMSEQVSYRQTQTPPRCINGKKD